MRSGKYFFIYVKRLQQKIEININIFPAVELISKSTVCIICIQDYRCGFCKAENEKKIIFGAPGGSVRIAKYPVTECKNSGLKAKSSSRFRRLNIRNRSDYWCHGEWQLRRGKLTASERRNSIREDRVARTFAPEVGAFHAHVARDAIPDSVTSLPPG